MASRLADLEAVETIVRAAGTSFYHGMRVLPPDRRHAMYAIYAFCRIVDDIADEAGRLADKRRALAAWREPSPLCIEGRTEDAGDAGAGAGDRRSFSLRAEDFIAIIDGMETDAETVIVAPEMAVLDLYCDRVASAVGRLSVRAFGDSSAAADRVAFALGRALQLTNILRDIKEDAGAAGTSACRANISPMPGCAADPAAILTAPGLPAVCERLAALAHGVFPRRPHAMESCDRTAMKPARLMGCDLRFRSSRR